MLMHEKKNCLIYIFRQSCFRIVCFLIINIDYNYFLIIMDFRVVVEMKNTEAFMFKPSVLLIKGCSERIYTKSRVGRAW